MCKKREASSHLIPSNEVKGDQLEDEQQEHHFCRDCADEYFAQTPGMNSSRDLICLSDWYRSKLYDLFERVHPEAFNNSTTEKCIEGSELMRAFLHEHLKKDGIEMNEDGFEMLCGDFFGSHHFYKRAEKHI